MQTSNNLRTIEESLLWL